MADFLSEIVDAESTMNDGGLNRKIADR